jgi:hypothetical protein
MITVAKKVTLDIKVYSIVVDAKEVHVCGTCPFIKERFNDLSFSYGCSYVNVPLSRNDTQGYLIPDRKCPLLLS